MNILGSRSISNLLLAVVAPACLAGLAGGCSKESPKADPTATAPSASASAEAVAADVPDVDPPAPVVSEDPAIPLHEAVVGSAPVADDYYANTAAPEALVEDPPARPEPSNVWIPGYWWWSNPLARYVWVTGAWRNPPPEQVWAPGSWVVSSPGRYVWSPGFWGPRGFSPVVVESAPPPLRAEVIGAAPEVGFFWTPGYYAYRGGSYAWVGGSWGRPPVVGLGWVEPRYVGFGSRFYFQPGRWDFAAGLRGTAYLPNITARAGAHISPVACPSAVVSAQAGYVSGAASAVAHGGTRTAGGGYTTPKAGASAHGSAPAKGSPGENHGKEPGGIEHHGAPINDHPVAPEKNGSLTGPGAADHHVGPLNEKPNPLGDSHGPVNENHAEANHAVAPSHAVAHPEPKPAAKPEPKKKGEK